MKPYTDIEVNNKYIIREFSQHIDPIELMWHRDDEDRTLEVLKETDWKFQFDDSLPIPFEGHIFIPRHEWHRVIKGTGNLLLKIHLD
jgi:acetone carboxylase gamma subunit